MLNCIKNIFRMTTLSKVVKKAGNYFNSQVKANGQGFQTEIAYPYGLKSSPPEATRCATFLSNANSTSPVSIPMMPAKSALPDLSKKDVLLGDPKSGHYILVNANGIKIFGNVEIQGNTTMKGTLLTTDNIVCNKNVIVIGDVSCDNLFFSGTGIGTGEIIADDCKTNSGISLQNHTHDGGSYVDGDGRPVTGTSGPPQ